MPDADPRDLARDWIDIWRSEMSAAASDREMQESWQALAALWAGAARAMLRGLPRGAADGDADARPAGNAAAAAPAGPAPAAAAPDARDAEIDRLGDRIAELERRLAAFERDRG